MRKILTSVFIIAAVAVAASIGSWAYFQDKKTANNNTIQSGTMDLTVNNGDNPISGLIAIDSQTPGSSGSAKINLKNAGSLNGELDIETGTINDYACDPDGANDETEFCDTNADLGDSLQIAFYIDANKSGDFDSGDIGLKSDGNMYNAGSLDYGALNDYDGKSWDAVIADMNSGTSVDFRVAWEIPTAAANNIQGDKVNFGINFYLEQLAKD